MLGDKVAVFVDVQNAFYSARSAYGGKLNYSRMLEGVVGDRKLVRAIAYIVQRPNVKQSGFHEALSKIGFELKVTEVKDKNSNGKIVPVKGNYSIRLTIDALNIASKVDTVILISGGGEYIPLVCDLQSKGVRVEIFGFDGSTSGGLIKSSNYYKTVPPEWILESKGDSRKEPREEKIVIDPDDPDLISYDEEYDEDDEDDVDYEDDGQPQVKGQPSPMGMFE
jgi:uncharacterized LabA/DUF88 family protein